MRTPPRAAGQGEPHVIGWREYITLPDLGLGPIMAKIDTGAHTAALHALGIEVMPDGGEGRLVRFHAVVDETRKLTRRCALPLHGLKRVKNSGGAVEQRCVVETEILLGGFRWRSLFTLTDRADMGFPILLGRSTIRRRFLVSPNQSFLFGGPGGEARPVRGAGRADEDRP